MTYAVITGDLVNYSQVERADKDLFLNSLKEAFHAIRNQNPAESEETIKGFDIFRGDSFQGVLSHPEDAIRDSILIRAAMRKNQPAGQDNNWDARIAIGLGTVDHLPENISEGDGPAFRNSGPILDNLKGDYKLAITTPWEDINNEFQASCALLDAIIAKWTPAQAEIVCMLLQNKKAKTMADELDISQAAVHYRVKGASWFALEAFLERYHAVIETQLNKES